MNKDRSQNTEDRKQNTEDKNLKAENRKSVSSSHPLPSVNRRLSSVFCPILFIASAVLLTLIQPPSIIPGAQFRAFNYDFHIFPLLAWVAYVPFIIACSPKTNTRKLIITSFIVGYIYWLGNLYWIIPITIIGWLLLGVYMAVLWPLLAICIRFCRAKKVPLFLACAVLIVGAERMQGIFMGGFFWRFLAHSQFQNITLIQIADIFGAGGVSFLIAMVNGLIAVLILDIPKPSDGQRTTRLVHLLSILVVTAAFYATINYGRLRLAQEKGHIKVGPLVASLQSNVPQSVKRSFESGDELFYGLMADSNDAAQYRPELIVWPETMVQAMLNPEVLQLIDPNSDWKIFDHKLSLHAKDNAYLLVGAYGGTLEFNKNMEVDYGKRYNSAFMYRPSGEKVKEVYNKIHLVPFGEVLPLRKSLSWFYQLLMKLKFIPYNFDYSLDAGSEYTIFKMASEKDPNKVDYRFGVMICYEDTVPAIARKFALDENGKKRIDWMVNISNDGWFVRFKHDNVYPSTELIQHTATCVFRAIENRLSVVRSVNTGISCLIDSYGRIRKGFQAGTLPHNPLERTGMSGWIMDTIPIDNRTTIFSKYGELLDFICETCTILLIIILAVTKFLRAKKCRMRLAGTSNEKVRK